MEEFKEKFIVHLLESGVLRFAPTRAEYFTLKSGRKSPYFANMASAMDSGAKLAKTATAYANSLQQSSEYTVLHGPAMKGIPLAPVIATEFYDDQRRFAFDFKEGPEQIRQDPLIGTKLRREKPGVQILDTLDAGLLRHVDCSNSAATALGEDLYQRLTRDYSLDDVDCIVGKAYGGIVPAALLVKEIAVKGGKDIRFVYDRISAKTHGVSSESNFVGPLKEKDRIIVVDGKLESVGGVFGRITQRDVLKEVDDVITTGKAKRESKHKVEKIHPHAKWSGVHVAVYRGEVDESGQTVQKSLEEHGLDPLSWIVSARDIFEFARNREVVGKVWINDEQYQAFLAYMKEFGAEA